MKATEHNPLRFAAAASAAVVLCIAVLAGCAGQTTRAFPGDSYPEECVTPTAPCPPGNE